MEQKKTKLFSPGPPCSSQSEKWIFYGASVTQQHQGYFTFFKSLVEKQFHDKEQKSPHLIQKGFGAIHLKEAIFLLRFMLDKEIGFAPSQDQNQNQTLCFLEWLTTGTYFTLEQVHEFIEAILHILTEYQVCPIFLLLYNNNDIEKRHQIKFCWETVAKKHDIMILDLYNLGQKNFTKTYFKDYTHLTEAGGKFFGQALYDLLFQKKGSKNWIPCQILTVDQKQNTRMLWEQTCFLPYVPLQPKKTKTITVAGYSFVGHEIQDQEKFILPVSKSLLALWIIVGLDSGSIELQSQETKEKLILWDPWCYYDRFMIRCLHKPFYFTSSNNEITIQLLTEDPPYHTAHHSVSFVSSSLRRLWLIGWTLL